MKKDASDGFSKVIVDPILCCGGSHPVFCRKMSFILCNCRSTLLNIE